LRGELHCGDHPREDERVQQLDNGGQRQQTHDDQHDLGFLDVRGGVPRRFRELARPIDHLRQVVGQLAIEILGGSVSRHTVHGTADTTGGPRRIVDGDLQRVSESRPGATDVLEAPLVPLRPFHTQGDQEKCLQFRR